MSSQAITPAGHGGIYGKIVGSSAIYSIAIFTPMAVSFIMLPVYTRYLTTRDYGIVDLLVTTQNLFGLLLGGRFADALFYFYANANGEDDQRRTLATAVWGSTLVGFVAACFGCAAAPWLSRFVFQSTQWTFFMQLTFISLGVSLPLETGLGWLRAVHRPVRFVGLSLARLALALIFTVTFVVGRDMKIAGVLWSTLATNGILALGVLAAAFFTGLMAFSPALFLSMVRFSIPLGASGVALMIIHSGDRFFLQRYTSLSDLGLYSLAYRMGMLVSYFQAAFGSYWEANVFTLIRGSDGLRRFARINTYQLLVLTYVALNISTFSSPVLHFIATPKFWACTPFIPWITAAYMIRSEADYFRLALFAEGKVGIDARLNWISATVCLAAYAVLIPLWRSWGAIAATALTFTVLLVLSGRQIVIKRQYPIEGRRLATLLIAAVAVAGPALWAAGRATAVQQWMIAIAGAVIYPAILYAAGFLLPSESIALRNILSSLRTSVIRSFARTGQA
jgi:O-antigen/teichoic acid export membrane protein